MWIFSDLGFYSVVCARKADGLTPDYKTVMVRARLGIHLENLKQDFPAEMEGTLIKVSAGTDYLYRIILSKATWRKVLSKMASKTRYCNFKGEVARNREHLRSGYTHSILTPTANNLGCPDQKQGQPEYHGPDNPNDASTQAVHEDQETHA